MIGVVLTGHGSFAPGLADSLRLIAGEQERFAAVAFTPELSPEDLSARLLNAVEQVGKEGVLILCDLAGGTPFNETVKLLSTLTCPAEVLAGVNLPALIEACTDRDDQTPASLAQQVQDTGREGLAQLLLGEDSEEDFDESRALPTEP